MSDASDTCKCGRSPNPRDPSRCTGGHCLPGHRGPAWRHGIKAYEARGVDALPAELRTSVEDFRDQVVADRGGIENLTAIERAAIQRLTEVETVCRLTSSDLATRGLVRGTFDRWVASAELWLRFARHLGMDRRARPVEPLDAYLRDRT